MVLLVVMEWTAAITGDCGVISGYLFLQGEKFGATIFQGGNKCSLKVRFYLKMPAAVFVSVLGLAPQAAYLDVQQTHIRLLPIVKEHPSYLLYQVYFQQDIETK
jgi:hypothetical protein